MNQFQIQVNLFFMFYYKNSDIPFQSKAEEKDIERCQILVVVMGISLNSSSDIQFYFIVVLVLDFDNM